MSELARRDEGNDPLAEERVPGLQPSAAAEPVEEPEELPEVKVPTPEQMEAALAGGDLAALPDDNYEDKLVAEGAPAAIEDSGQPLPGVIVGATLARELEIHLGDRVKVISPLTGIDTSLVRAGTHSPKSRDFKVIGIFEAGFQEYDSRLDLRRPLRSPGIPEPRRHRRRRRDEPAATSTSLKT